MRPRHARGGQVHRPEGPGRGTLVTRSTMAKAEDNDGSPGEQRQDDDQGRWGRVTNTETMTVPTCTLHRVGGAAVYVDLQYGGAKLCRRRRLRARPMHRQGGLCGTCLQESRAADFCTTSDQARITRVLLVSLGSVSLGCRACAAAIPVLVWRRLCRS